MIEKVQEFSTYRYRIQDGNEGHTERRKVQEKQIDRYTYIASKIIREDFPPMKGNIMTNTTAALAQTVSTSTDSAEIESAFYEALDLMESGAYAEEREAMEDITIALTSFSTNRFSPESIIKEFWENQDLQLLTDGVRHEFISELYDLPDVPDSIREEIEAEREED